MGGVPAPELNDSPATTISQPIRFPGRRAQISVPITENGTPAVVYNPSEMPGIP
jgi:hypothetical protein